MKIFLSLLSFFVLSFSIGFLAQKTLQKPSAYVSSLKDKQAKEDMEELKVEISPYYSEKVTLERNMTFYGLLRSRRVEKKEVLQLINMARPFYNLAKIPLGTEVDLVKKTHDHSVVQIRIFFVEDEALLFRKKKTGWAVTTQKQAWDIVKRAYRGHVDNSLWESLVSQGLDEKIVYEFIKIFAWQMDFDRETKTGDTWKILIEEKRREGKFLGWRNIVYAEYRRRDKDPYHGIRFPEQAKQAKYYSLDGENLAGLFLKSPVNFTRISSKFQRKRYHPILKIQRPHYGIDYAAARGTPVYSVGDGVIKRKAYSRGSGNFIVVKHNRVYETAYRHLHGFAKNLKVGKKIKQGEVIGYVGSTGLATGPHLHFEFLKNNKHVDPLGTSFPKAGSVALSEKEKFRKTLHSSQQELNLLTQNLE